MTFWILLGKTVILIGRKLFFPGISKLSGLYLPGNVLNSHELDCNKF